MSFKEKIDSKRLPKHIAIIMDGNGRWAKQRGEFRVFGHENGVSSVREVSEACTELGIQYLTLYAFSTENWNRPKYEVTALMELLVKTIHSELKTLNENKIKLLAIGDIESLEENCKNELREAIQITAGNTGLNLVLALSYSSRWEITNAAKCLALEIKSGKIDPEQISQEVFEKFLNTSEMPDPRSEETRLNSSHSK